MKNKVLSKFFKCKHGKFDTNSHLDEHLRINECMFYICNKEHFDPPFECENCKDFEEYQKNMRIR